MSLKTVSNLKDSVSGILSGIDLGTVDNLNGALERAANVLITNAFIPEAKGTQAITLYSGVYDYPCDDRIYGTKIIDVKPVGTDRTVLDFVYKKPGDEFDRTKNRLANGTMVAFDSNDGAPIIQIVSTEVKNKAILDPMNATTGWSISAGGYALAQDISVYYQSPASLRFSVNVGQTAILSKTITSIDLSTYTAIGVIFVPIYTTDATRLTDTLIRIGSDSSNYYEVSNDTGFLGSNASNDFFLMAFDLATATQVGSPDMTKVTYIAVGYESTIGITNVRFGGMWISFPYPCKVIFQSSAIFKAASSTAKTSITDDADEIILNLSAYTLYEFESAIAILEQTGGAATDSTLLNLNRKLNGDGNNIGLYAHYRGDNPSQELRTIGNYYE